MREADVSCMRRALVLAQRGRGTVSPNPLVGCVVTSLRGDVVGEGWHERAGGPHAEIVALAQAGVQAAGGTAYVTLEPCAHTGRTGPCTLALLAAGVSRVVVAVADPHPAAAGGAERLRGAGVQVEVGVLADEAAQQNRVFLHALARRRPFVVAKAAVSLDGRIAAADGTSQWLTGEASRARAHQLRAEADAVLVGSGTVLADDPRLTTRLGNDARQPLRVVLDRRARVPADRRVFDAEAPTLLLAGPDADRATLATLRAAGVDVDTAATLPAALCLLYDRGVRSVLVEGGAHVLGSFVRTELVDELVVHVAPVLLGSKALPLLAGDGIATLAGAPRFTPVEVERLGDDTLLTCTPRPAP